MVFFSRSSRTAPLGELEGSEYTRLRWTRNLAAIFAAVWGLGSLVQAAQMLWAPAIELTLPVWSFWPKIPAGVEVNQTTATVVDGTISQVVATVEGLNLGTRALLAGEILLLASMAVVALIGVVQICAGLLRGEAFHTRIVSWLRATAWVFLAAGIGSQVAGQSGRNLASAQAFDVHSGSWPDSLPFESFEDVPGIFRPGFGFSLEFWPIGVWLVLMALATAFSVGSRLSASNRRLKSEITGLV
ncbi:hypothetical protein M2390_001531 [Mycetocola sp. BIGb0189]|uniref:hypothetical protein n=1 Tax=Mycetocola sp. BIGb0189 TaxID=2940604 RepID=UPI0021688045|nr:hypothetical protein [Mycetocola sp. BIGb0189]MCS4276349.1 hypothetical protein [Mycetocola sp. BIGb0189]